MPLRCSPRLQLSPRSTTAQRSPGNRRRGAACRVSHCCKLQVQLGQCFKGRVGHLVAAAVARVLLQLPALHAPAANGARAPTPLLGCGLSAIRSKQARERAAEASVRGGAPGPRRHRPCCPASAAAAACCLRASLRRRYSSASSCRSTSGQRPSEARTHARTARHLPRTPRPPASPPPPAAVPAHWHERTPHPMPTQPRTAAASDPPPPTRASSEPPPLTRAASEPPPPKKKPRAASRWPPSPCCWQHRGWRWWCRRSHGASA